MTLDTIQQVLESKQYPADFKGHWIGGEWVNDRRGQDLSGSLNPSNGQRLVHVNTSKFLVEQAIDAAHQSFSELSSLSLDQRLEFLEKFRQVTVDYRDLLVLALRHEAGKPLWEAEQDFNSAIRQLNQVLEKRDQLIESIVTPYRLQGGDAKFALQPLGVCAVFQTFSTPLNTVVQSLIAGLVAGCPLVIMPSSHAALNGLILSHLLSNLELPNGAVNVVFGNYQYFSKALQDRRIKGVIYSGSREHCDTIRGDYSHVLDRELMLQSGGKNSVIIHSSASMDDAIRLSLLGVVKSAGQLNTSTSRIFVHKDQLEAFGEKVVPVIHNLRIGPTDSEDKPLMGPLYSQKAVDKFLRFQTMAKREAEETLVWGKAYDPSSQGFFVSPGVHVFNEFDDSSSYQSNVFMCPDVVIYPYEEMEEAISWANTTNASHVTSLVGDKNQLEAYLPLVKAPNVMINLPTVGANVQPLMTGRELCGGHRYNGFGLVALMTYPQASQSNAELEAIVAEWPWEP
ncbi:aldehyde dehydrogenase family protein [Pseudobacteriovorax antillogorgiicola]|uniref:Acyl-CoA reductase n=1 Tax=Pseudobacteriovorax antillogorgiicola TaxID=1513793 RepID=A0A1Y6CJC4_9BACT|nr:aldehyde dehydrogenase [Pseudobacteriovorax antillogorgiicola]TCS46679.1 acyl-CoA reductase-like NAD-dependent aldehyde dehydrogenase [Pseudobacteriovorax antillogorgiicola]SMF66687.1 Acyl-CoA reductase [Pseudobacteriovorax antillogorgiicola]